MYTRILFIVAVCVKIAFAEDCTQKVEPTSEMYECCMVKDMAQTKILEDPCVKNATSTQLISIECIVECLYKEHDLMINDSIVIDNMKKYFQVFMSDDANRNRFVDGAEACNKLGKKNIIKKFGHLESASECSGYYRLFDYCIMYNALTRCSEQLLRKSEYCRSQVKFLNECIFNKSDSD